jgi:hypothetical protein
MTSQEFESKNVARLLEQAAARSFSMAIEDIIPAFDAVEEKCISQVSSTEMQLEVRRRVAEWKMKLFCDRDARFDTLQELRANLITLGHSDLANEGTNEIYFAMYCARNNQSDTARSTLTELCEKLDAELQRNDSGSLPFYRHLKKTSEDLLARLSK